MTGKEEIIITISPKSEVQIKVVGYNGPGCKALTADLEKALGQVKEDSPTKDMYAIPDRLTAKNRA